MHPILALTKREKEAIALPMKGLETQAISCEMVHAMLRELGYPTRKRQRHKIATFVLANVA